MTTKPTPLFDDLIECPQCGHRADLENFDCIGADGNNVFCNCCTTEFDPDTGAVWRVHPDASEDTR